jgi:peptidyl-prolyl cis-trans isomerase SurA
VEVVVLGAFLLPSGGRGEEEVIDRIVAVVGNEVILLSELRETLLLTSRQLDVSLEDSARVGELEREILKGMVEEKVILQRAKVEGIEIPEEELDAQVDQDLERVIGRFNSREEFEMALSAQGLDLYSYREQLKKEKEKQMIQQRFVQGSRLPFVRVSNDEARRFFDEKYGDRTLKPPAVRLTEVVLRIALTDSTLAGAREKADEALARIELGESFESLVAELSEDEATRERGGELGMVRETDLIPEIANAVSNLYPGEVSRPVQTVQGIHIFKVLERKGSEVNLGHILFRADEAIDPFEQTMERAKQLAARIKAGEEISEISASFSTDEDVRAKKGDRGEESLDNLPPAYREVVDALDPGEVSDPFVAGDRVVIVKVVDKLPARPYRFEEVRDQLIESLTQEKAYQRFVEDLEKKTYINIRL